MADMQSLLDDLDLDGVECVDWQGVLGPPRTLPIPLLGCVPGLVASHMTVLTGPYDRVLTKQIIMHADLGGFATHVWDPGRLLPDHGTWTNGAQYLDEALHLAVQAARGGRVLIILLGLEHAQLPPPPPGQSPQIAAVATFLLWGIPAIRDELARHGSMLVVQRDSPTLAWKPKPSNPMLTMPKGLQYLADLIVDVVPGGENKILKRR